VRLLWKVILVVGLAETCCGWGTGTVQEPRGTGTFAVGSRYLRAGTDTVGEKTNECCSELQSV
jgi:hypothetical protein